MDLSQQSEPVCGLVSTPMLRQGKTISHCLMNTSEAIHVIHLKLSINGTYVPYLQTLYVLCAYVYISAVSPSTSATLLDSGLPH